MRTRVRLRRSQGTTVDLVITTDVGATVADVAEAIARAEAVGGRAPGTAAVTLAVTPPGGGAARSLPRRPGLAEAGLRAGSIIALVPASDRFVEPGVDLSQAYARLTVISGPQSGLEVNLPKGTTTVGRGPRCEVRLTDPFRLGAGSAALVAPARA